MKELTAEDILAAAQEAARSGQAVKLGTLPKGTMISLHNGKLVFTHPDHPPIVETETGFQTLLPGLPPGNAKK